MISTQSHFIIVSGNSECLAHWRQCVNPHQLSHRVSHTALCVSGSGSFIPKLAERYWTPSTKYLDVKVLLASTGNLENAVIDDYLSVPMSYIPNLFVLGRSVVRGLCLHRKSGTGLARSRSFPKVVVQKLTEISHLDCGDYFRPCLISFRISLGKDLHLNCRKRSLHRVQKLNGRYVITF